MVKSQKLIERMRANPRDWRIEELETVAKSYGVNIRKSGGSHVVFDHPSWVELLSIRVVPVGARKPKIFSKNMAA